MGLRRRSPFRLSARAAIAVVVIVVSVVAHDLPANARGVAIARPRAAEATVAPADDDGLPRVIKTYTFGSPPGVAPFVIGGFSGFTLDEAHAIRRLEDKSIAELAALHDVPADDRLLDRDRDEIRALVFQRIIEIVNKPAAQRDADEQLIYAWQQTTLKTAAIKSAQAALAEFNEWQANPCTYAPPPGFTHFDEACFSRFAALFTGVTAPKYEEFLAYGATETYASPAEAAHRRHRHVL